MDKGIAPRCHTVKVLIYLKLAATRQNQFETNLKMMVVHHHQFETNLGERTEIPIFLLPFDFNKAPCTQIGLKLVVCRNHHFHIGLKLVVSRSGYFRIGFRLVGEYGSRCFNYLRMRRA